MDKILKVVLIILSVISGVMFVSALCYSFAVGYNQLSQTPPQAGLPLEDTTPIPFQTPFSTAEAVEQSAASTPGHQKDSAPAGQGSHDGLTWDGLKIDIVNTNYNAWPLIKLHNQYNDPPLEGMLMLMITLRVTNVDGAIEEPVKLWDSDFKLIDGENVVYETFEVSCGVVPDEIDGVVGIGDSMDGKVCFQVAELKNDFRLIYEPYGTPAVYFKLPHRLEIENSVVEAPSVLVEGEQLTPDGAKIGIVNVNNNGWPLIKAQNSNNKPPVDGMTMLLITIRVTNVAGSEGEPVSFVDSDFQLIGDRKTVYKTFQVSCGVVPDKIDGIIAPGDSMDGNVCFQVSKDEAGFQLIYETFDSPAIYLPLPGQGAVK